MVLEEDFNGVTDIASWVSEEFCRNCITYTRGFGCRLRDGSLKMESVKRTTGAGYDRREEVGICIIYISIFGSVGRLFLPTNITHSSFHDQSLYFTAMVDLHAPRRHP
jgi:hypothetical protein